MCVGNIGMKERANKCSPFCFSVASTLGKGRRRRLIICACSGAKNRKRPGNGRTLGG